jgi:hypothetical protein
VTSDDFKALPPEIRHEILTEMKETRKRSHWCDVQDLPQDSTDFSDYQMSRLIKKSKLTNQIVDARKEMNARSIEGVVESLPGSGEIESQRIMSQDASHVIFVKGMKKTSGENTSKTHSINPPEQIKSQTCTNSKVFESQPKFAVDTSTVVKSTKKKSSRKNVPKTADSSQKKDEISLSNKSAKDLNEKDTQGQGQGRGMSQSEDQGHENKTVCSSEGQGQDKQTVASENQSRGSESQLRSESPSRGDEMCDSLNQSRECERVSTEVVELDDSGSDVEYMGQAGTSDRRPKYSKNVQIRMKSGNVFNCQLISGCTSWPPRGGSDAPKRIVTSEGGSVESESGESDVEVMDVTQKSPSEVLPPSQRHVLVPVTQDILQRLSGRIFLNEPDVESNKQIPGQIMSAGTASSVPGTVDMTGSSSGSDSDIEVVSEKVSPSKPAHRPMIYVQKCQSQCVQKRTEAGYVTLDSDSDLEEISNPDMRCSIEKYADSRNDQIHSKNVADSAVGGICDISDGDAVKSDEGSDIEIGQDSDEVEMVGDMTRDRSPSVAVISSDEAESEQDGKNNVHH